MDVLKPGDVVVVTMVPQRADRCVRVGDIGVVESHTNGTYEIVGIDYTLVCVRINGCVYWWSREHLKRGIASAPAMGPDVGSIIYWVRKLIKAESDLDVDAGMAALHELRKLDQQIPANWPEETIL